MNLLIQNIYLTLFLKSRVGDLMTSPYIFYCHNQQEDIAGEELSNAYNDDMTIFSSKMDIKL